MHRLIAIREALVYGALIFIVTSVFGLQLYSHHRDSQFYSKFDRHEKTMREYVNGQQKTTDQ